MSRETLPSFLWRNYDTWKLRAPAEPGEIDFAGEATRNRCEKCGCFLRSTPTSTVDEWRQNFANKRPIGPAAFVRAVVPTPGEAAFAFSFEELVRTRTFECTHCHHQTLNILEFPQ